jgi:hypothetical protein
MFSKRSTLSTTVKPGGVVFRLRHRIGNCANVGARGHPGEWDTTGRRLQSSECNDRGDPCCTDRYIRGAVPIGGQSRQAAHRNLRGHATASGVPRAQGLQRRCEVRRNNPARSRKAHRRCRRAVSRKTATQVAVLTPNANTDDAHQPVPVPNAKGPTPSISAARGDGPVPMPPAHGAASGPVPQHSSGAGTVPDLSDRVGGAAVARGLRRFPNFVPAGPHVLSDRARLPCSDKEPDRPPP